MTASLRMVGLLAVVIAGQAATARAQIVQEAPRLKSFDRFLTQLQAPAESDASVLPAPLPDGVDSAGEIARGSSLGELIDSDSVDAEQGANVSAGEGALTLADVVASLYRSYPEIAQARLQRGVAGGELLSAYGAYDKKLGAFSLSEPTGFYENYRNGIGVSRQTWWGGYLSAGYRIGRGFYQPWYKERQTDDGGEISVAVGQPLLQGRAIDPQRVALFQASLAQQTVQPHIELTILQIAAEASNAYWEWVAAGAILEAQRELTALAVRRGEQYEAGVKAGKFAEIDLILNQQLVAERRATLLVSEQKLRTSSFKLSLFLRDESGQPIIPADEWLPAKFPAVDDDLGNDFQTDLPLALTQRPEPRILDFELRQVQLDRRMARNRMLPRIDFVAEASQDFGEPSTKSDDKGEFELVIGFRGEVPIERRKARGKIQSTTAKMAQIDEKIRLTRDKIAVELQTAYNMLDYSSQVVQQSELALRAAVDTLDRYRFAFDRGKIDLIYLNLLETKTNETEIKLVEAQRNWFSALAQSQVALGLDPLDQAMIVSELPPGNMPGPGDLPPVATPQPDELKRDWDLHLQGREP